MTYENIYKGLTEEERQKMMKADIPKCVTIGSFEMTEEMKEEARKDLLRLMKEFK